MKKNIIIAVTVLLSLAILVWGIEYLKGGNLFKPSNYYYVKFDNVDGLVEATPVTIKGFKVGQVRDITYDYETNKIMVMMSLDKDVKLPIGSKATIESSLMGSASMVLTLADNKKYYDVGAEIEGGVSAGLMDKLTGDVVPQVDNMLPKVDSILGNVNALVGNPALRASITRLDAITGELAESSKQLTALMNNLNKNVPAVMGNVNVISSNLSSTTGNLDEFTGTLKNMPIDSTLNNLNATITNLQKMSNQLNNKLNDKNSSLGLLMNDRKLYDDIDHTVSSLDSIFVDVKKNPKRYISIKLF